MELSKIGLDRNLYRSPAQNEGTKNPEYVAANPQPQLANNTSKNKPTSQNIGDDDGTKNIYTGTVITACLIQTSALPSRVELEGNNLTFYDNTYEENGVVKGDTSRLVFTHDLNSNEGFIMEKRASIYNTYDNVLSWYATPAKAGAHNYMFIGRNAYLNDDQRYLNSIHFNVNKDTTFPYDSATAILNGVLEIEYSEDGAQGDTNWKPFFIGNSEAVSPGLPGFSAFIAGGEGGLSGLGYAAAAGVGIQILLYCLNETQITIGADMIPDASGVYDIGAPGSKMGTFYGSVVACPLPTIENPIDVLERIAAPVDVEGRGHYGDDKKYFDDLTFPEELLHTTSKGNKEIEHTTMIGFLLQTVIELNAQVKDLKARLPK